MEAMLETKVGVPLKERRLLKRKFVGSFIRKDSHAIHRADWVQKNYEVKAPQLTSFFFFPSYILDIL